MDEQLAQAIMEIFQQINELSGGALEALAAEMGAGGPPPEEGAGPPPEGAVPAGPPPGPPA